MKLELSQSISTFTLAALVTCGASTAQRAPTVVRLEPAHMARDVDAKKVAELVVEFDQDMDRSAYSVCGGGPSFPTVAGVTWRDDRTFVLQVTLEEDRVYSMDLSCIGVKGFWSKAGERLAPTPWRIATQGPKIDRATADKVATRLFMLLRNRYSYRDRLGIDWSDFETRSYDELIGQTSMAALALTISETLVVPQDPHVAVRWLEAQVPTFQREARSNFDIAGVRKLLPDLQPVGRTGMSARTKDGYGYLFIGSFSRDKRRDFELCIRALRRMLDCKGLVIDVRENGGGDENLARRLAGFFVERQKTYAAHRYRDPRAPGGFGPKQLRTLRPNAAPDIYRGPVAVLMGPANMSSCEAFLLMMKQVDRAHLVGSTSYGSSGNPKPHAIAPGLTVLLPSWQALRADGTPFEGEGIQPTAPIEIPEHMLGVGDPVLEEALTLLRKPR
ncbi:MAG: S41 family peptidase [bacterium]|nr:S41 family peptidase [bacterium]